MDRKTVYLRGIYGLSYMSYLLMWGLCNKYCYITLYRTNDFFLFRYINLFLNLMAVGGLVLAAFLQWRNSFSINKIKKALTYAITGLCVLTISFIFGAPHMPLAIWYIFMFAFNLCSSLYTIAIFGLVPALENDRNQHPGYYSSLYIGIGLAIVFTLLIINTITVNITIIIYLIGVLLITTICHCELIRTLPTEIDEPSTQHHKLSQLLLNREFGFLILIFLVVSLAESMGRNQIQLGLTTIHLNIFAMAYIFIGTIIFYGVNKFCPNNSKLFIIAAVISTVTTFLSQYVHSGLLLLICHILMGVSFIIIDLVLITQVAHLALKLKNTYGFASLGLLFAIPTGANTLINLIKTGLDRILPITYLYFMLPTLLLLLGLVLYIWMNRIE